MKKKITILALLVLVATSVFAGDYVYWTDSRFINGATLHYRICLSSKVYNNADKKGMDESANSELKNVLAVMEESAVRFGFTRYAVTHVIINLSGDSSSSFLISLISAPSGEYYKIMINNNDDVLIYEKSYSDYNSAYADYERQCNKYLKKL